MSAKLTPARLAALRRIADGEVFKEWAARGPHPYMVRGFWQKPAQSPYVWLIQNAYATLSTASGRDTPVALTILGTAYLSSERGSS